MSKKKDGDVKKREKNAKIFEERLKALYPNYEILGNYRDRNTEVSLRCKIHDIIFKEKPGNIFKRNVLPKCPECLRVEKSKPFVNYIKQYYPTIDYIKAQEAFVDYFTPVRLFCKVHPEEVIILSPEQVMGKSGNTGLPRKFLCNVCKADNDIKDWVIKFEKKFPNHCFDFSKSRYLVDHYITGNPNTKITNVFCKNCGKYFTARASVLINSCRCPECCGIKSVGEAFIESWLNNNSIDFKSQVKISHDIIEGKFKGSDIILDFQIKYNNIEYWVEYNGEQHYTWCKHFQTLEKFEGQLRRDINIRNYCKNNNIILIEIPYRYRTKESVWELLDKIIIEGFSPNTLIKIPEINYNRGGKKNEQ